MYDNGVYFCESLCFLMYDDNFIFGGCFVKYFYVCMFYIG